MSRPEDFFHAYDSPPPWDIGRPDAPRLVGDAEMHLPVGGSITRALFTNPEQDAFTARVMAGSLPPGMTLGADGTLTGSPQVAGRFEFSVETCDSHGACSVWALAVGAEALAFGVLPFTGFALGGRALAGLVLMLVGLALSRVTRHAVRVGPTTN